MKEYDIVKQWIGEGYRISFWGATQNSLYKIGEFIQKYGEFQKGYIFDSFLSEGTKEIFNHTLRIKNRKQYNIKDTKLILCLTLPKSYHEVMSYIESMGAVYGVDYIDAFKCVDTMPGSKKYPYERIRCNATYAPWRNDDDFILIYNKIKNNTLIDIYRLYSLWMSCKESIKCPKGDVLEVGVWRGGSGALLGYGMNKFCKDETAKIYLCDTFEGVVKAGWEDSCYVGGEHNDTTLDIVEELLSTCEIKNYEIVKGIFPDDSYEKFDGKLFRLVHIDVDVYKSAKEIFNYVWEKMVLGGMIIFDDYGFASTVGVTRLCEELAEEKKDARCIFNLNGEAVLVKYTLISK